MKMGTLLKSVHFHLNLFRWGTNYIMLHPIVFAYNATNVTITGGGVIYGQGQYWYDCSDKNRSAYPCDGYVG